MLSVCASLLVLVWIVMRLCSKFRVPAIAVFLKSIIGVLSFNYTPCLFYVVGIGV